MGCSKHPIRSRKDCLECYPDITKIPVKEKIDIKNVSKKEEELLTEPAKEKVKFKAKDITVEFTETQDLQMIQSIDEWKKTVTDALAFKKEIESIEKYFNNKKEEFNKYIEESINSYRSKLVYYYEHLDIPTISFNIKDMYELEKDGFHLVAIYSGDVAKASGYKESVSVFKRIKSNSYKKNINEWKARFKK